MITSVLLDQDYRSDKDLSNSVCNLKFKVLNLTNSILLSIIVKDRSLDIVQ